MLDMFHNIIQMRKAISKAIETQSRTSETTNHKMKYKKRQMTFSLTDFEIKESHLLSQ